MPWSSFARSAMKQWSGNVQGLAAATKTRTLLSCVGLSSSLFGSGGGSGSGSGSWRAGDSAVYPSFTGACNSGFAELRTSRQNDLLSETASCASTSDACSRLSFSVHVSSPGVFGRRSGLQAAEKTTNLLARRFLSRAAPAGATASEVAGRRGRGKRLVKNDEGGRVACPGCGIYMQDKDPKAPGYFKRPAALDKEEEDEEEAGVAVEAEIELEEDDLDGEEEEEEESDDGNDDNKVRGTASVKWEGMINWQGIEDWAKQDKGESEMDSRLRKPYHMSETEFGGWNEVVSTSQAAKEAWSKVMGKQDAQEGGADKLVVCARCHSLRHYAQVKDEDAENLLPDFDFDRLIGARLKRAYGRRAVVVMVIDAADFDGSFPRKVAALLAEVDSNSGEAWKDGMPGNTPRLVVVLNKIDLLPKQVSPNRLEQWVRRRARAGGAPRLSGVHLVSAYKGWGIAELALQLKDLAGSRGDVWVVGAQNAGKSSLINAFGKLSGGKRASQLTEAPLPGTTIGILKLEGILPAKARLFDTPGILHPHQLTTRLNRDELKVVQARKEVKPRTYRVKAGTSIYVGGLVRLDVVESSVDSFYISVFVSAYIPLHMGKTETAEELLEKHLGNRLTPPMDCERLEAIGRWVPRKVSVTGDQWDVNSTDIAMAGLGWLSFGIKGTTAVKVWTFEGVAITTREALIFDKAVNFEKPGFTAPIAGGLLKPDKDSKKGTDKKPHTKSVQFATI